MDVLTGAILPLLSILLWSGHHQVRGQAVVTVTNTAITVREGDQFTVKVKKVGAATTQLTVIVQVLNPQANGLNDFIGYSHPVVFPAGTAEAEKAATFTTANDLTPEKDEVFVLQLSVTAGSATVGTPGSLTVTITANDDAFGIFSFYSLSPLTVEEKTQENIINIEIRRDKGTFGTVAVAFQVSGSGEARPGVDITPASGSISFTEGQASRMLQLKVTPDTIPENDESFGVKLLSATGGVSLDTVVKPSINISSIVLIIGQNDAPVRFSQDVYRVDESSAMTSLILTVYRGLEKDGKTVVGPVTRSAQVKYQIRSGSAVLGQDFRASNGTLAFSPGTTVGTIRVEILPDDLPEISENFTVILHDVSSEVVLDQPSVATVIINGNDDQNGILSLKTSDLSRIPSVQVNEDSVTEIRNFVVLRSSGTFGTVSVAWKLRRGDNVTISSANQDVSPLQGTVTLGPGVTEQDIVLKVVQDVNPEPVEIYNIELLANSVTGGARVEGIREGQLVIEDSDNAYGMVRFGAVETQRIVTNTSPRTVEMNVMRVGGSLSTLVVNYTADFIVSGEVVKDILTSDSPAEFTLPALQNVKVITLPIRDSAFLKLGAQFRLQIQTVRLETGLPVGPFNSPTVGTPSLVILPITTAEANGEVGFASTLTRTVNEPDGAVTLSNILTFDINRDGTNGEAVISWSLTGSGTNAKSVTATDAKPSSGVINMASGDSMARISIEILADDIPEMDEELTLTLTKVTPEITQKLKAGATEVKILIRENDNPGGTFQFASFMQMSYTLEEEGQPLFVTVVRSGGSLLAREVQYYISPNGEAEFYGSTNVLKFEPGETVKNDTIVAKGDGVPELTEKFVLSLKDYGESQAVFGVKTKINITVPLNDDPFGIIKFPSDSLLIHVNESSAGYLQTINLPVLRTRGAFGSVGVNWAVLPSMNNTDIKPLEGLVTFTNLQTEGVIHLQAMPDNIPEENEKFQIVLLSAVGGAAIGSPSVSTIVILKNDDAIFFEEPSVVRVNESGTVFFTVWRNGSANFVATVRVRTVDVTARAGELDYVPIVDQLLTFGINETQKTISVSMLEDAVPETQETLQIELFNATGDVAVYGTPKATVIIAANDDANGIFRFSGPFYKLAKEGVPTSFDIIRERGRFSEVQVYWEVYVNSTGERVPDGTDFLMTSGQVTFSDLQASASVQLLARADGLPEYVETFTVKLVNITGGGPDDQTPQLADVDQSVVLEVAENDDPYGVFDFPAASRELSIAEDYYPGDEATTQANFTVERRQGTFKIVQVAWEIFSYQIAGAGNLPKLLDLLFLGTVPASVTEVPSKRRPKTGSVVLQFPGSEGHIMTVPACSSGTLTNVLPHRNAMPQTQDMTPHPVTVYRHRADLLLCYPLMWNVTLEYTATHFNVLGETRPGAFVNVSSVYQPDRSDIANGFSVSAWLQPATDTNGYILAKTSADGTQHYYAVKVTTSTISTTLEFRYTVMDTQQGKMTNQVVAQVIKGNIEDGAWHHVLLSVDSGLIQFYIDGKDQGQSSLVAKSTVDGEGPLLVGAIYPGEDRYTGYMQDVRIFSRKLDIGEIKELYETPSMKDVEPISGYLTYKEGERNQYITVQSIDDNEEESNDVFSVKLISAKGGARVSDQDDAGILTVLKSDNANGLFGFAGACEPMRSADENVTFSCTIERQRGDADSVLLSWIIVQRSTQKEAMQDFHNASGQLLFIPGERSKKILIHALDDTAPELTEVFDVILTSVTSTDGVMATTNTSGASINPERQTNNVTILANDYPYGYLQFSDGREPATGDPMILPATQNPTVSVLEEARQVELLVVRAQGLLGAVSVEWRTKDGTAKSSGKNTPDYVAGVNRLTFTPGQRFAYITITIIDDSIPEDSKYFEVELVNPSGGASIGVGSVVRVIITPSDFAYGLFRFAENSLNVSATEVGDMGFTSVSLEVIRQGGDIGDVNLTWYIQDDSSNDFLEKDGQVTFATGQRSALIQLKVKGDLTPELDEDFHVTLNSTSKGDLTTGSTITATVTILANDDPYGTYVIATSSRPVRTNEIHKAVSILVERSQDSGQYGQVRITYTTLTESESYPFLPKGVNRAGISDFVPTSGTLEFEPNERFKAFNVTISDDAVPEMDETVFVRLIRAELLQGAQANEVLNSPRLGAESETYGQIIINQNDYTNGILELSTGQLTVAENFTGPLVSVVRGAGAFGEVTVKFETVAGSATYGLDFSVTSTDVVLGDGERRKTIPVNIINDILPENAENFTIRLLNQITGGAILGNLTSTEITIEPSDDPQGAFGFEFTSTSTEEPSGGESRTIQLPIIRTGGTLGVVTVNWEARLNGTLAARDVSPTSGSAYFVSNEARQIVSLNILADNDPEGPEVIDIVLTQASNGGRITGRNRFLLTIQPNDNPHGTIQFAQAENVLHEHANDSMQYVNINRIGGTYGELVVNYSTDHVDIVKAATQAGQTVLSYFTPRSVVSLPQTMTMVSVAAQEDPLLACATACLVSQSCLSFYLNSTADLCVWFVTTSSSHNSAGPLTYHVKNTDKTKEVYSKLATADIDYQQVSDRTIIIPDGATSAQVPVTILSDEIPELQESFLVTLNSVRLTDATLQTKRENLPSIGKPSSASVVIAANDNANGVFSIYSNDPRMPKGGRLIMVDEIDKFSVELIIERRGGSIGEVSVRWLINTTLSTATKGLDYIADGAGLTFSEGETSKAITIGIKADTIPEDDETIVIELADPQGGAVVSQSEKRLTVIIKANDHVAGILQFVQPSVLAKEGESLSMEVSRSAPALGNVTVHWSIRALQGATTAQRFLHANGTLFFQSGVMTQQIELSVLADNTPRVNQEFIISLTNLTTTGIRDTGAAALHPQNAEASITIEGGNNPHGIFSFAPTSLLRRTPEANISLPLILDRKFGAIGVVRIFYEVRQGSMRLLSKDLVLAKAREDFMNASTYIDVPDGATSAVLPVQIVDDDIPEVEETFVVTLTEAQQMTQRNSSFYPKLATSGTMAEIIINANDGTMGEAIFPPESARISVNETTRSLTLTVLRDKGVFGNVSVFCFAQSVGDQATLGKDFTFSSLDIDFAQGESRKTITVQLFDDDIAEPDEQFEIILASPKGGLALGIPSKAVVTILASDSASGIVSFTNMDNVTLREPSSGSSTKSRFQVALTRAPGKYGVVNVPFVIVGRPGQNVTDITPVSGFITFQDRQDSAVLELTALSDNEPEEMEMFSLILKQPDGGAALGNIFSKFIFVEKSDSPYGLVELFAAENRSAHQINVEENTGLVYFDLVRTQGTLGHVTVDVNFKSGGAKPGPGASLSLYPIQRVTGRRLIGWYSFEAYGAQYAVMLNGDQTGVLTTAVGSDGSVGNVTAADGRYSMLYRWQGMLVPVQTIETDNVMKAISFRIKQTQYLFIVNNGDPGKRQTKCRLYQVNTSGSLKVVQDITCKGSTAAAFFSKGGKNTLVLANYIDGNKTSINSDVYVWDTVTQRFGLSAHVATIGAMAVEVFEMGGDTYLAVANYYDMTSQKTEINSAIHKLDANGRFALHQQIPTMGARDVIYFTIGDQSYLVFANGQSNAGAVNLNAVVYVWDASAKEFKPIQKLPANQIQAVHNFHSTEDDRMYLVLANTGSDSAIYGWDAEAQAFNKTWSGTRAYDLYPITIKQTNGDIVLLAEATYVQSNGNSSIFMASRNNGGDFVPRTITVSFEPGQRQLQIAGIILDDDVPENTEDFTVELSSPTGGVDIGENKEIRVDILANDNAFGVVQFAEDSLDLKREELANTDSVVQLNVVRGAGNFGRVVVRWVATGDHDGINDIMPIQGKVEFADGQSAATISLTIRDDGKPELDELTMVTLTQVLEAGTTLSGRGATIGLHNTANLTVMASDSPHGVVSWNTATPTTVTQEPLVFSSAVSARVIREQGTVGDIRVYYITERDTSLPEDEQAVSGRDYVAKQASVDMKDGQLHADIEVVILSDDQPEVAESFLIRITGAQLIGKTSTPGAGPSVKPTGQITKVTIAENDNARGVIDFGVSRNNEGVVPTYEGSIVRLAVVRSHGFFGSVTVTWQASPQTAQVSDFSPSVGTIRFREGQKQETINVTIVDDKISEDKETFIVRLMRVTTGGASLGRDTAVTVSIIKNDSPNGMFSFPLNQIRKTVRETTNTSDPAGVVTYDVIRTQGTQGLVTVRWRLEDKAANDFLTSTSGELIYQPGDDMKTITLQTKPDNILEGEERFAITLVSADNNADISPTASEAIVIILPDAGASGSVSVLPESAKIYIGEPVSGYDGSASIHLTRGVGVYGQIRVSWQIFRNDITAFERTSGDVTFQDRQQIQTIIIQARDDTTPEALETFTLELTSAVGAQVNTSASTTQIVYVPSDYPHGLFEFSQPASTVVSEDTSQVSVRIVRNYGTSGQVKVTYMTSAGSAVEGKDYQPRSGDLTFNHNENNKIVQIPILKDSIPEGPEQFFVNITKVEMISPRLDTSKVGQVYMDMAPTIGPLSAKTVIIAKNDNAEGTISFAPQAINIQASEEDGVAMIPVARSGGTYGTVAATYRARNLTATPSVDYRTTSGQITFSDGQSTAYINITLINDEEREFEETFQVILTGATGGAQLGGQLTSTVTISKSDYPNGKFGFKGQTEIMIPNPSQLRKLSFTIERTGGLKGQQTVKWRIMGPNNPSVKLADTSDVSYVSAGQELTYGSLTWADDEAGEKMFVLNVKPHGDQWEVQKEFVLMIEDIEGFPASSGNGEVSTTHKLYKLTILKFGQPNGVIGFSGISQQKRVFLENAGVVVFPIYRFNGTIGEQLVRWKVIRVNSDLGVSQDIRPATGQAVIAAERRDGSVSFSILDDDIAEMTETFRVILVKVDGGADLDPLHNTADFDLKFSDYPHGRFGVLAENQRVIVTADLKRQVVVNVTRHNGLFGKVAVNFVISYDLASSGALVVPASGQITFGYDQSVGVASLDVSSAAYLSLGSTFTVTLTSAALLGEPGVDERPEILASQKSAKVTVPQAAANSEIGFQSVVANVHEAAGISSVTVYRWGSYGKVQVDWAAGFLPAQKPSGFEQGTVSPSGGTLVMQNGQDSQTVNLTLQQDSSRLELFAVHLPRDPVSHTTGGAARLKTPNRQTMIEPYGVIGFAPNSRVVSVLETQTEVKLTIQRSYGAYKSVQISYNSTAGTASPGLDYTVNAGALTMTEGVSTTTLPVQILTDTIPEDDEYFYVRLNSAMPVPNDQTTWSSPRVSELYSVAKVTIVKNSDPFGVLAISASSTVVKENSIVTLTIRRLDSAQGEVSVWVRSVGGGEKSNVVPAPGSGAPQTVAEALYARKSGEKATAGQDYDIINTRLFFNATGPQTQQVMLRINEDSNPEGDERVFVYLTDHLPRDGARVARPASDKGAKGWVEVLISRSDLWNGNVGFAQRSLSVTADEDRGIPAELIIRRTSAFASLDVSWTARLTTDSPSSAGLTSYLVQTSGVVACKPAQFECAFKIFLRDDKVARNTSSFIVQLSVAKDSGAQVNNSLSIATVIILANDYPNGLLLFPEDMRLINIDKDTQVLPITVQRTGFINKRVAVSFSTQEMTASTVLLAGNRVYKALAGSDFTQTSGLLTFNPGQASASVSVVLDPSKASSNLYPKVFRVVLTSPSNGAELDSATSTAQVVITEKVHSVWKLWLSSQRNLDNSTLINLMNQMQKSVETPLTNTDITVTEAILTKAVATGEINSLSSSATSSLMDVFCTLVDPKRSDATRGRWQLIPLLERFTFTLLNGEACETSALIKSPACAFITFSVARWKPSRLNSYKYIAENGDYFKIPDNLLPSSGVESETCKDIHFIEYNSEQWFSGKSEAALLNSKVIAVGIKGQLSRALEDPVVFQVHTPDSSIVAKRAECVYFDSSDHIWTSGVGSSICSVSNNLAMGIDNYVECSCKHMSSYAVKSVVANPDYIGYPVYFHIACGICMLGMALAIYTHHICSKYPVFSASLIIHLCFACFATQMCYVIDALMSPQHILNVAVGDSNYRCIVMAAFLHYFFLAQFTWMLAQAVNMWKILVLNDEHTERKYFMFFLLGWGLPAVIVAVFYLTTYLLYRFVFLFPTDKIYGDVSQNADICFVTNPFVGLAGVIGPALVCMIIVGIIFLQVFEVRSQWQAYDDIYRGRYNINEVRLLLGFWACIVLTGLWGGLHMAYGQLWLLILYCVFTIIQGLYAFIVYTTLRSPCIRPQKASYSVNVGEGPESAYHVQPLSGNGSIKGSRASLINDRWEKDSISSHALSGMHVKRSPGHNGNIYVTGTTPYGSKAPSVITPGGEEFESTDFDDLIFALKTGGGYPVSEASHPIEREIDIIDPDNKYEMRRISIADTHL